MAATKSRNRTAHAIEGSTPVISLPPSTAATVTDTVVLFELDGREYHVPAKPRAAIALRYLRNVKHQGTDFAAAALMEELLGVDGFEALANYDDLTAEQFKMIMEAAQKLTLGAMEEAFQGNSNGSGK